MKSTCSIRFSEELNDFLAPERRKVCFSHEFQRRASIKDMIEALGVPHTEIDLILVNGDSVGFSYIVRDGDRISVYPMFETFDIRPVSPVFIQMTKQSDGIIEKTQWISSYTDPNPSSQSWSSQLSIGAGDGGLGWSFQRTGLPVTWNFQNPELPVICKKLPVL